MPPKRRGANRHILNRLCLAAYFLLVFLTAILQSPESSGEADIDFAERLAALQGRLPSSPVLGYERLNIGSNVKQALRMMVAPYR